VGAVSVKEQIRRNEREIPSRRVEMARTRRHKRDVPSCCAETEGTRRNERDIPSRRTELEGTRRDERGYPLLSRRSSELVVKVRGGGGGGVHNKHDNEVWVPPCRVKTCS